MFSEAPTAWNVSKYGVSSGSYVPVFGLNTEILGVIVIFIAKFILDLGMDRI